MATQRPLEQVSLGRLPPERYRISLPKDNQILSVRIADKLVGLRCRRRSDQVQKNVRARCSPSWWSGDW